MKVGRRPTGHRRGALVYARRAVLQPTSLAIALGAVIVGALAHEFVLVLLAVLVLTAVAAACAPHVRRFRHVVDCSIDRLERERAASTRSELLARMSEAHRRELHELELIADRLREHYGGLVHETYDVSRLLELYVRLAIAHKTTFAMLDSKSEPTPEQTIAVSEMPQDRASAVTASLDRRFEILRKRVDARRAAREHQRSLAIELATVADIVRWMNEACAAVHGSSLRDELRTVFAAHARDAGGVREIVVMQDDETVDPDVLRLGRECAAGGD